MKLCRRCGSFDGVHDRVEGDCVLPHRAHSRTLLDGTDVCVHCVERHREWLVEILDLYGDLDEVLEPGSICDDTADHTRTKKPAEPAPVRLDAFTLLFDTARLFPIQQREDQSWTADGYLRSAVPDIPAVLSGWARNACDEQRLAGASLDSTLRTAVRLLTEHAERIAGFGWVGEYDAELGWCLRALRRAHGIQGNPPPLGACITVTATGSCTGSVWADPGGQPYCDRCKRRYDRMSLVRMKAMSQDVA